MRCRCGSTEDGRLPLSAAAGLGRPLPAPDRARPGRLHAARHDHRRCGRANASTRRRSFWAWAFPAGRPSSGPPRAAIRSASPCRGRCGSKPGCDFSFSGLKTAVRQTVEKLDPADANAIADLCASFQRTVGDVLADRCANALAAAPSPTLVVAGGVAANLYLRGRLRSGCGPARRPPGRAAGQALHRQRRHDRLGRHRAAAARLDRRARLQAAAALAARSFRRRSGVEWRA